MSGTLESQSMRLEVISAKNLEIPSERIPAGIYVYINVDSRRRWKSAIKVLLADKSVAWGDVVTLSSQASSALSIEIRVSYELNRMLGNGEVIGKLETSWDELLNHANEPFELSFPPVCGVHPSLTLKTAVVHACDNQAGTLFDTVRLLERQMRATQRLTEYTSGRTVSHLNGAVEHFQLVLDQCPVGHPDQAAALTNLAWARLLGYIRKDIQDIDTIIALFRKALALRPHGHPDHTLSLYCLILALNWCYDREDTAVCIHESAQLCCDLLPLCPEGTYLRSIGVDSQVDYVIPRYNTLPIDASNEGIRLGRNVLKLCPLGHQHRPSALDYLAQAVEARFDQHGSIDDLEESIQLGREAVSLCPEEDSSRDTYIHNLAFSLKSRFDHQAKFHDLDEAITLYEEALRLRPVGHKYRNFLLDNLGLALWTRFAARGDIDDITRAISLHREALALRPSGNPHRGITLGNLALMLQSRFAKSHVSEESDLNEAIDLCPPCNSYKFELGARKNEDVKEAIDLCEESLLKLPPLHPDRYFSYLRLGEAYLSRYRVHNNPVDLSLAVENFRLASRHDTQGFLERIQEAIHWTDEAERHSHASALEAYQTFFELLDRHLAAQSSIVARRESASAFRRASALPVNAASCAIRLDNLRGAVELVEQGRGQQWSLASRLRSPLEDLEFTNPILAHKFSELSKRLSDAQGSAANTDRAAADRAAIKYRKLTNQWDAVVAQILIILIASQYSCSAIIVPTSGEPYHVPLPSITLADLENLKSRFAWAIPQASRMGLTESRTDLIVLLRAVWNDIMLPIVNVLENVLELKRRSRIWLCPTAAFTSIPLHAAHPYKTKADRSGRELCLEDLYICSYTPTLSALIRSRQMMKTHATPPFVAIGQGQPGSGNGKELLAVDSELELQPTRAGALEALEQNSWVHLACHGKQDHDQPYNSHFVMRDKPLTLLDIMEEDIPHAEFAFLSACHTAAGDDETPDEVIHLAAGIQFSGFKSVVGTLWEVDDAVAKHVVEAFYETMFDGSKDGGVMDCTKAARALNHAKFAVMKKVPLEQRIVFIHIGV
ncbi:CHAT domain-containing protein [Suillus clintonianus]|uniref:CHAT domain-containing protein n=1 Tax=Suillus clintonianus TaxID=1904413 RepID=UPI001B87C3DB|nr:CHAT domain-containing protein [Suillus clintonianus]KAG2136723.1 CHAT domain-containing protein [Suillus clintonianus]